MSLYSITGEEKRETVIPLRAFLPLLHDSSGLKMKQTMIR
jgi:hypothetical protein